MNTQAHSILQFYKSLRPDFKVPKGVTIMNPYADPEAWKMSSQFYKKYYSDKEPRVYIFGINPGRFGGGITGVPFTDPIRLQEVCGIPNTWKKQAELSSQFIYAMIGAYGSVEDFYRRFFITAPSPLGYTVGGKNLNYYDDKGLLQSCEPFMVDCIYRQLDNIPSFPFCYCLGEGENFKQFNRLNAQHGLFKEIIPLPHPRWVMQYRRKQVDEYVALYVKRLNRVPVRA